MGDKQTIFTQGIVWYTPSPPPQTQVDTVPHGCTPHTHTHTRKTHTYFDQFGTDKLNFIQLNTFPYCLLRGTDRLDDQLSD